MLHTSTQVPAGQVKFQQHGLEAQLAPERPQETHLPAEEQASPLWQSRSLVHGPLGKQGSLGALQKEAQVPAPEQERSPQQSELHAHGPPAGLQLPSPVVASQLPDTQVNPAQQPGFVEQNSTRPPHWSSPRGQHRPSRQSRPAQQALEGEQAKPAAPQAPASGPASGGPASPEGPASPAPQALDPAGWQAPSTQQPEQVAGSQAASRRSGGGHPAAASATVRARGQDGARTVGEVSGRPAPNSTPAFRWPDRPRCPRARPVGRR